MSVVVRRKMSSTAEEEESSSPLDGSSRRIRLTMMISSFAVNQPVRDERDESAKEFFELKRDRFALTCFPSESAGSLSWTRREVESSDDTDRESDETSEWTKRSSARLEMAVLDLQSQERTRSRTGIAILPSHGALSVEGFRPRAEIG